MSPQEGVPTSECMRSRQGWSDKEEKNETMKIKGIRIRKRIIKKSRILKRKKEQSVGKFINV